MDKFTHRERIEMIIAGEKPDRFAGSLWRHFFHMENNARGTAEAMIDFQKMFEWDFIKVNPRADYHVEDWGLEQKWSTDEFKKHEKLSFPIKHIEDWEKINVLPLSSKALAEHLKVITLIKKGVGKDVPILMTMFTPLAIAGRMVPDRQMMVDHLRNEPDLIHTVLNNISETFSNYATELRNAGADGLFFATTQWASEDMLTWDEYKEFGVPYDLKVMKASCDGAINLFHVCASNNYLSNLAEIDYKSQLYNWESDDPTNIPLDKSYDLLKGKTIVGGVDMNGWLQHCDTLEIKEQMNRIKAKHDSARVIIGPGCAIPPEIPMENIRAVRDNL